MSDLKFTNDDLIRIKMHNTMNKESKYYAATCVIPCETIDALINRLEKAEAIAQNACDCCVKELNEKRKAWFKSKGESDDWA